MGVAPFKQGTLMKLLPAGTETASTIVSLIKKSQSVQFSMAWATVNNPVYKSLLVNLDKITASTLGISGYATAPKCLTDFTDSQTVRFAIQKNGLFHPKVYLFERTKSWDLILGSANMTTGGLQHNSEVMVHLTGQDMQDPFFQDIKLRLNSYHSDAVIMDEDTATKYAEFHKLFKKKNPPSITIPDSDTSKHPLDSDVMAMSWKAFKGRVKQDPYHGYKERIQLLTKVRGLFKEQPDFGKMELSARKLIAGLPTPDYENWGWFGSMQGAGYFHSYINKNNPGISRAMDAIPLNRPVTKNDYDRFISHYTATFVDGRDGIGTASRLLAMKRPDQFVCLSSANKKNLCLDFGISKDIDYDSYWHEIIARIEQSIWWNTEKPSKPTQKAIWQARAALLDTLYYEEAD